MAKPIRKWWAADRKPLKVNVSEAEEIKEASTEDIENPVDTVEENKIQEVEDTVEENVPVEEKIEETEEKPSKKESSVKEWTEEELAVLSREEFAKAEADILAGKAKVKPRTIHK